MKRAPIVAIACLLATLPLSCRRRLQRYSYPTSQPSNAAVAGKYAVVGDSEVIKQYGAKGTLDVCPDGTFVMRNMPGWGWQGRLRRGATWSGHGTWTLINNRRELPDMDVHPFVLRLEFDEIAGRSVHHTDYTPHLVGKAEPYDIYICIGDPDLEHNVILRKSGEPVLPTSGHLKKEAQADN